MHELFFAANGAVVDAGQPTGGWVPSYRVGFVAPAGLRSARLTVLDCKTTPGILQLVFDDFFLAPTSLRLHGQRFKVDVTWKTSNGQSGPGTSSALSADTGYFWFFRPENVELVIKVLDGCAVNGHYWVFAGGLTDVHTMITVTDTQTAAFKTYTNPQGKAFLPIQDTSAFATCP